MQENKTCAGPHTQNLLLSIVCVLYTDDDPQIPHRKCDHHVGFYYSSCTEQPDHIAVEFCQLDEPKLRCPSSVLVIVVVSRLIGKIGQASPSQYSRGNLRTPIVTNICTRILNYDKPWFCIVWPGAESSRLFIHRMIISSSSFSFQFVAEHCLLFLLFRFLCYALLPCSEPCLSTTCSTASTTHHSWHSTHRLSHLHLKAL